MKFWEAMQELEAGKRVSAISSSWPEDSYLDKDGILAWFEKCPAAHYYLDEWELYEEPERTLSFMEVVHGLKEGKRFARASWGCFDVIGYIIFENGSIMAKKVWETKTNSIKWNPNIEDFEAIDWLEAKE